MRLVSRQSQVELTLAASIGLDGDGGSGYLGEDSVFDFSLDRSAVTGLDGGVQAPDQLLLEPTAGQRCWASIPESFFFSLLFRKEFPPRVHPPATGLV